MRTANGIEADPGTEILVTQGAGHAFLVRLPRPLRDPKPRGAGRSHTSITARTRAMILHNRINTTGQVMGLELVQELAARAKRNDFAVLSDEVYERFIYEAATTGHCLAWRDGRAHGDAVWFFEGSWGLRVGYPVSSARIVAARR